MKKFRIYLLLFFILSTSFLSLFSSCGGDDDSDCKCSDDSAPYSAFLSSTCYATEDECEDAEGKSCSICI